MPEPFFAFLIRFCNIQLGSVSENLPVVLTYNLKIDVTFAIKNIFSPSNVSSVSSSIV